MWRDAFQLVSRAYVPGPYTERVTILWAENDSWNRPVLLAEVWREAGAQVDLRIVPGNHVTCLTRHVDVLADEIRMSLDCRLHAQPGVASVTEVGR